jgi:hypothetical protein
VHVIEAWKLRRQLVVLGMCKKCAANGKASEATEKRCMVNGGRMRSGSMCGRLCGMTSDDAQSDCDEAGDHGELGNQW